MDRDIRKPAMLTGGFSHRSSLQDSNSNSGSNDTMTSGGSTDATTISDSGSPYSPPRKSSGKNGSSSKSSPRRSGSSSKNAAQEQDTYTPPGVTFDEEVQDLVAVSRMMIERQEGAEAAFVDDQKKKNGPPPLPKLTRPVVSCLKKKGSNTSLQSRNGRYESGYRYGGGSEGYGSSSSASSTASSPTSSSRRRRKRVTFKKSAARRWFDHLSGWIPFMSSRSGYDSLNDLEAQQHHQAEEDDTFWSRLFNSRNNYYYGSSGRRYSMSSLMWTGLTIVNLGLLFVGLVLALMNLGDGIGMEAASIFLVVSCLCMGTSVWAHLIRMDGQNCGENDDDEDQDPDVMPYSTTCISTKNNVNERTGLLSRTHSSSSITTQQQYHSRSSLFKTRWVRTRLLPVVTFLCLVAVVGLNAIARAYPGSEEIGSD